MGQMEHMNKIRNKWVEGQPNLDQTAHPSLVCPLPIKMKNEKNAWPRFARRRVLLGRRWPAPSLSPAWQRPSNHKSAAPGRRHRPKEIRVRNGDRVAAGQTPIVLEDERTSAGLDLLAGQWDTAAAKTARLQTECDFGPNRCFRSDCACAPKTNAELLRMETSLFQSKRLALSGN